MSFNLLTLTVYFTLKTNGFVTFRSDATSTIKSDNEGPWGDWGEWRYCNPGQYMNGIDIYYEPDQGKWDDTGVDLLYMRCAGHGGPGLNLMSERVMADKHHNFGKANSNAECSGDALVWGFKSNVEPKNHDNSALNNVRIYCTDGKEKTPAVSAVWGEWSTYSHCGAGEAICGFRNKVEAPQAGGDDSGVNAVQFKCCSVKPRFSGITGRWVQLCPGCTSREIKITSGITHTVTHSLTKEYKAELSASISSGFRFASVDISGTISDSVSQALQSTITQSQIVEVTTKCDKPYFWQWQMNGYETIGLSFGEFELFSRHSLCNDNAKPNCLPNHCKADGTPIQ